MRLASEIRDGVAIITVSGKLVFDESLMVLREEIKRHLLDGIRAFVIDLAEVPYCDSSGSGEIIGAYASIRKAGGALAVTRLSDRVRRLWTTIRLNDVFDVFDTVEDALAFVRKPRSS